MLTIEEKISYVKEIFDNFLKKHKCYDAWYERYRLDNLIYNDDISMEKFIEKEIKIEELPIYLLQQLESFLLSDIKVEDSELYKELEENKKNLTPAEMKVCKILEENPYPFHTFSGSRISETFNVPQASITRFVQKLGYDNYADFRMDLAMSERRDAKTVDNIKDSEKRVIDNVSAVRQVASKPLMDEISEKLINAHHVY